MKTIPETRWLKIVIAAMLILLLFVGAVSAAGTAPSHPSSSLTVNITNPDGSTGTQTLTDTSNIYLIETEANWEYVTTTSSLWTNTNAKFVLTGDIRFTKQLNSIGDSSNIFVGKIYGNGYRFVSFIQNGSLAGNAHGLIYQAGNGCELNTVCLYCSDIESSANHVGGLVGYVDGQSSSGIKLYGCSVQNSNVSSSGQYTGGLIGYVKNSKITVNASYVNRSYLAAPGTSGFDSLGGLVGYATNTSTLDIGGSWIDTCKLEAGTYAYTGGIIGQLTWYPSASLTDCSVTNCTMNTKSYVGGLVGNAAYGYISIDGCAVADCTLVATGTGSSDTAGGLIGYDEPLSGITLKGGVSSVTSTWLSAPTTLTSYYSYIGSVVGLYSPITPAGLITMYTYAPTISNVHSNYEVDSYGTGYVPQYLTLNSGSINNSFTNIALSRPSNLGSVIDVQGLTPGNGYGYSPYYPVTVATNGNGTAFSDVAGGMKNEVVKLTAVADTGYHLGSWTSSQVTVASSSFTMPTSAVTVTAKFAGNVTTVNFMNDSTLFVTKTYTFNTSAALPATDPTKEGYLFTGWNITVGGQNYTFSGNTTYIKDGKWVYPCADGTVLTVNATWLAINYTITNLSSDLAKGFTTVNRTVAIIHDTVNASAFAYPGYRFINWTCINLTSPVLTSQYVFSMPAKNVTLTANFGGNITTVNFMNDSTLHATKEYTFNEGADLPAVNPAKDGYTFAGWNITVGGQNYTFTGNTTYIKNSKWVYQCVNGTVLTVNASWGPITYTITNLTDSTKGYTTVNKTRAILADTVNASAFAYPGYRFINWTCINLTSPVLTSEYVFSMPAKNVTLTANFAANVTTVNFMNDTGIYATKMYTFGDSAALPTPDPAKNGYTFTGWKITPANVSFSGNATYFSNGKWVYPCANGTILTVNASWKVNSQGGGGGSSSSHQSGYTMILPSTGTADHNATRILEEPTPAVPTLMPTATKTSTPKSPVPVAGLFVGLGVAAFLLRARK